MDMDIKQQQHHQHQHHETAASMHDFNTDLVEGNNGDVDGDGGGNVFQSDDLDDGQYFDEGQDSDTADSDEHSLKKQKLV